MLLLCQRQKEKEKKNNVGQQSDVEKEREVIV